MLCFVVICHSSTVKPGQTIATFRTIVGRDMLGMFGHPVATCCDMLGVVGSNLTISNFSNFLSTKVTNEV